MNSFNAILVELQKCENEPTNPAQNISFLKSFIFEKWEDFQKLRKYFAHPYCFFFIADTIQRRIMVMSVLVERVLPKGVRELEITDLLLEIFVLKAKGQTNKNKA